MSPTTLTLRIPAPLSLLFSLYLAYLSCTRTRNAASSAEKHECERSTVLKNTHVAVLGGEQLSGIAVFLVATDCPPPE